MERLVELETIRVIYRLVKDNFCYECDKECEDCRVGELRKILCELEGNKESIESMYKKSNYIDYDDLAQKYENECDIWDAEDSKSFKERPYYKVNLHINSVTKH